MPGRNANAGSYRYGFNGIEKADEVAGSGNHYTADYRTYDPRLGRWTSIDPIVKVWESPYAGFSNNPIFFKDPSGLDPIEGGEDQKQTTEPAKSPSTGGGFAGRILNAINYLIEWGDAILLEDVNIETTKPKSPSMWSSLRDSFKGLQRFGAKLLPGYKYKDGYIENENVVKNRIPLVEKDKFTHEIEGIMLHRTVSEDAESTMNWWANPKSKGVAAHFIIDTDGTIYQTGSMERKAWHVGGTTNLDNFNTIGIEVVGMPDRKNKTWDKLTDEQIKSTAWLVNTLLIHYNLYKDDIHFHENHASKTAGEGKFVYEAIQGDLINY